MASAPRENKVQQIGDIFHLSVHLSILLVGSLAGWLLSSWGMDKRTENLPILLDFIPLAKMPKLAIIGSITTKNC